MIGSMSAQDFDVVAHRGNAAEFPENSLGALQSAVDLGALWLEIDVQLSADGVAMMLHDETLERVAGIACAPWDRRANELTTLTLGQGQRISTLAEVSAWLARTPGVRLFVELKRASLHRFGHEQTLAATFAALGPVLARCILISFDLDALAAVRRLRALPIGWVLPGYDAAQLALANNLQPDYLFVDIKKLPGDGALCRGDWTWCVYEVPTPALARHYASRGARLIETMQVRRLLATPAGC